MTNQADARNTEAYNVASAKEAKLNRDFQASQSATVHQREVDDLRAAGLNPILSANKGAPAASGATAQVTKRNTQFADLGASAHATYRNLTATNKLIKEQKKVASSTTKNIDAQALTHMYGAINAKYQNDFNHTKSILDQQVRSIYKSPTHGKAISIMKAYKDAGLGTSSALGAARGLKHLMK